MSRWVAYVILQEDDERRQRKILANMVSLGQHLVLANNFHSAAAVLAALQSPLIARLCASEQTDSVKKLEVALREKKVRRRRRTRPFPRGAWGG